MLECTVNVINECRNGERISFHLCNRLENGVNHLNELSRTVFGSSSCLVLGVSPVGRNVNLNECGSTCVDGLVVHVNNVLTFFEVGSCCSFLHVGDSIFCRKNLCKSEECRLKDCIGALAHTDLSGKVDSVYCVELNVVVSDVALCFGGHVLVEFSSIPLTVDEEYTARLNVVNHFVTLDNV